jgi:hypothetical protein
MQDDGLFKDFGFGVRAAKRNAASIKSYEGSVAPVGTVSAASLQGMSCTAQMQNNWGTTSWYTPCADYLISNTAAVRKAVTGSSTAKALDPGSYFADEEKNYALYGKAHTGWETAGIPFDAVLGMRISRPIRTCWATRRATASTCQPRRRRATPRICRAPTSRPRCATTAGTLLGDQDPDPSDFAQLNPGTAYITPNGTTVLATASAAIRT